MSLTLRGKISFDKKNLPPYIFKFNIALVCFFAGWFFLCLPPVIALGFIYGESSVTYITMIAVFAAFFLGLLIFCTVALKLRSRLVEERAAELEEEFADMPLEEATEILKERGVITEYGFVFRAGDLFGERVVPFDNAEFSVHANTTSPLKIEIYLTVFDSIDLQCGASYHLDGALFNFIDKRDLVKDYESNTDFVYLKHDKKNFCRIAFGFKLK